MTTAVLTNGLRVNCMLIVRLPGSFHDVLRVFDNGMNVSVLFTTRTTEGRIGGLKFSVNSKAGKSMGTADETFREWAHRVVLALEKLFLCSTEPSCSRSRKKQSDR